MMSGRLICSARVWRGVVRTFADGSFKSIFTLKPDAGGVFMVHVDSIIATGETVFQTSR